ncbi:MAG: MATE family efflux transporter [Clostridia bacterium]
MKTENQQSALKSERLYKLLLKYSIPAITGMLVSALYNIVDRIYIGKIPDIGSQAISGVGVTMPLTTIILAFGMLIGIGATANMSIALGKGNRRTAQKILGNALFLVVVVSLVLSVLGLVFLDKILMVFGASEDLLPFARAYMIPILIGTIFNMLSFSMNHTIRADNSPTIAGLTMVLGCVLNIILDPIFIFVFKMGISGAAIATVISQAVSAAWVMYYYFGGRSKLKINLRSVKPNFKIIMIILSIGVSPFAMQISNSVVQALLNNQLKALGGDVAIGAFTIISSVSMLFLMAIFGLNQGAQPIIGYNYGAKNYKRVRLTLKIVIFVGTVYLTIGFIVTQCFPHFLISLFSTDPALMEITAAGLKINLFTLPLLGACIMGSNFFQYIGKPTISLLLSVLRQFLLLIPILLILPNFFGLKGVWLAQPICDVISFVLIVAMVLIELKKQKRLEAEYREYCLTSGE